MNAIRIGHGYDLHRLEAGRPLVICGEKVPYEKGAVAHSDGDVVYHAVTDAVLGALGLEDIGQLFPDTDQKWKGQDSRIFVQQAVDLMHNKNYRIGNLDITIILEKPKLSSYKIQMKRNLAELLKCDFDRVNLKSKTHEKVDAVGQNRAIECHAVLLLYPDKD